MTWMLDHIGDRVIRADGKVLLVIAARLWCLCCNLLCTLCRLPRPDGMLCLCALDRIMATGLFLCGWLADRGRLHQIADRLLGRFSLLWPISFNTCGRSHLPPETDLAGNFADLRWVGPSASPVSRWGFGISVEISLLLVLLEADAETEAVGSPDVLTFPHCYYFEVVCKLLSFNLGWDAYMPIRFVFGCCWTSYPSNRLDMMKVTVIGSGLMVGLVCCSWLAGLDFDSFLATSDAAAVDWCRFDGRDAAAFCCLMVVVDAKSLVQSDYPLLKRDEISQFPAPDASFLVCLKSMDLRNSPYCHNMPRPLAKPKTWLLIDLTLVLSPLTSHLPLLLPLFRYDCPLEMCSPIWPRRLQLILSPEGDNMPIQQDAVPKNVTLGDTSNGSGALLSMDVHDVDKSQYLTLGYAVTFGFEQEVTAADLNVPLEMALHADLATEGHVVSNEQMISSTSPCLAHVVSKELVMDVKDSINSFAVLQVVLLPDLGYLAVEAHSLDMLQFFPGQKDFRSGCDQMLIWNAVPFHPVWKAGWFSRLACDKLPIWNAVLFRPIWESLMDWFVDLAFVSEDTLLPVNLFGCALCELIFPVRLPRLADVDDLALLGTPVLSHVPVLDARSTPCTVGTDRELVSEGAILPKRTISSKSAGIPFRDIVRENYIQALNPSV
ncbi:hypothetical protein Nepgr_027237 [Nepenthes gracilis]|uniref:Uncharacterized protein n=1 Tax=Nepenthes gracilis TaxID=150966 RepID=A0AAD3Y2X1_NEPGR|nr:hypothetical protein Nepgr_027237 [Nepenthes gracilis]